MAKKKTLLYVSPFWPMKSGISEYSEILVAGLKRYFDITLLIEQYTIEKREGLKDFKVKKYSNQNDYSAYDYIIYNFGNNPDYHSYMYEMIQTYPGHIILHDFILYYLTVGYYMERDMLFQKIYELEGAEGIRIVKESLRHYDSRNLLEHKATSAKLPLNKEVLQMAKGVFVHSQYTKAMIDESLQIDNISVIPLVMKALDSKSYPNKNFLREKFKIEDNAYILSSVGFIGPSKQNELVCKAVQEYNKAHKDKVYYVMIGDGEYVDSYLDCYIKKTGFLDNQEFFEAIISSDLIFNLRYPYNGEGSYTLIQCMSLGKPCIVTDIGWFSELPDNCVFKVSKDIDKKQLCDMIQFMKEEKPQKIAEQAKKYVREVCGEANVSSIIYKALTGGKRK